jgi:hypothetical protein
MIINVEASESIDKKQRILIITLPNVQWAAKLCSGEYRLESPDLFGVEYMMSEKLIKKIMNSGELPNLRIDERIFVITREPDYRVPRDGEDPFDIRNL